MIHSLLSVKAVILVWGLACKKLKIKILTQFEIKIIIKGEAVDRQRAE
jgi:hypothetical protein